MIQHHLKVVANCGNASGEGWYDAGDKAVISASYSPDVFVKHSLSGWRAFPNAVLV